MKIPKGALEFPMTKLQEQSKTLSHIDLVLSQLPIEILYGLQLRVIEELQVRVILTSLELRKTITDKDILEEKYDQLKKEQDTKEDKEKRFKR